MVSSNSRYVFFSGKWVVATSLLVVLACIAHGASVQDLYSNEVRVLSNNDAGRQQAMVTALEKVLVRVTGKETVIDNAEIKEVMENPASYVSGFSYQRKAVKKGAEQQWLKVSFDKISIDRLLTRAGFSIWGASRPATMVLLAVDNGGGRYIVHSGSTGPLVPAVSVHFQELALPVFFPLMDVEDTRNIRTADVWGLFSDQLMKSAKRYESDIVMAGRLYQRNELYSGVLSLFFRGQRYDAPAVSNMDSERLADVAATLVGSVLSSHYAVTSSTTAKQQVIVVDGIKNLESHAGMIAYLEKINGIRDVNVQFISDSQVTVVMDFPGSMAKLKDAIALGKKLKPMASPAVNDPIRSELGSADFSIRRLYYRWVE